MRRRFLRFICGSLCAAIAAALLAVVPGAAFAACLSPAGSGGDVWFNKDHAVMQYCNGTDWISMLAPGATIEPSGCDAIGEVCSDGSIYAGLSPDGNAPMFTTPADWGSAPWNNSNITGAVDTALQNCSTGTESACFAGDDNTLVLASADSDNSVGGTQPHLAARACNDLVALGRKDWYLPSIAELDVLHTNRASGALSGTFSSAADYWSSSEIDSTQAALFDFSLGVPNSGNKTASDNVRCVRKGDPCRRTTPTPGAVCDDGSIYAGLSPDGNRKMFTTAADAPSQMTWGGEGTDTALENCYGSGSVCTTGAANTALLAGLGAGYAAATYCDQLNEDGHDDWYLPALGELSVVYSNLGPQPDNGFQNGDYWTASEVNDVASYLVSFATGDEYGHAKNDPFHVRCVRVSSCTSPHAPAGAVMYNEDYRVLQWCDGADWQAAGPVSPSGPETGCVSPAGTGGSLVFNVEYRTLQYCDGADWIAIGKPCRSCGGLPTEKVAFYTLAGVSGRFIGGISGADQLCQDQAKAVGLGGTYKAWIADSNPASAPATRFTHAAVPYVRVDGTKIADDWTDLTDGTLDSVMTSETGYENLPINGVWSNVLPDGTQASGTATDHCDDWGTGGSTGRIGHRDRTDSTWTEFATITCFASDLLYCFEQ